MTSIGGTLIYYAKLGEISYVIGMDLERGTSSVRIDNGKHDLDSGIWSNDNVTSNNSKIIIRAILDARSIEKEIN